MAAIESKSRPVVKAHESHTRGIPAARRVGVVDVDVVDIVDRTAKLSDELLKSLETSERGAIEAIGRFVITMEEALPQEVSGTTEVTKKVTESGLEMTDRLVQMGYELLRDVVDSTADALCRHDRPKAAAA